MISGGEALGIGGRLACAAVAPKNPVRPCLARRHSWALSCRLAQASLHVDGQGVGYNKIISTPGTCTYVGFLKAGGEGLPVGHWLGFR